MQRKNNSSVLNADFQNENIDVTQTTITLCHPNNYYPNFDYVTRTTITLTLTMLPEQLLP